MEKHRILVSWIGYDGDFQSLSNGDLRVNLEGPNISMHRYFEDQGYFKHVILHTRDVASQVRMQILKEYFSEDNDTWPVEFKTVRMDDRDVVNIEQLQQKMQVLFMVDFKDYLVDILVSTGTKTMHTAWHLIHLGYPDRTRLIQIRPKQFTPEKRSPELVEIKFEENNLLTNAIIYIKRIGQEEEPRKPYLPPSLEPVYNLASKTARADWAPALILGEAGAGKELLARHLYGMSARRDKPFKTVNCAALSDELLWTELFGCVKDAHKAAVTDRPGLFEICDGGTLFLDEIGDISPTMQQALFRVLDAGEITQLGADTATKVDVRIIAATHRNLPEACRAGTFRWDLYYRIAILELHLPNLKEWELSERETLWKLIVERKQREYRRSKPLTLSREAKEAIFSYSFPGNVREMENLVSRLYVVADDRVTLQHLPASLLHASGNGPLSLDQAEAAHIGKVLNMMGHNKAQTAKVLGIAEGTLRSKCKAHNIPLSKSQSTDEDDASV